MKQRLDEKLLKSDFTFGFELEGCADRDIYSQYEDEEYWDDGNETEATGGVAYEIERVLNNLLDRYLPEKTEHNSFYGEVETDCSIEPDGDDYSFEWASGVFPAKPEFFQAAIRFLYHINDEGLYTNSSCGFHHHLSYKGITERDMIWIYCHLCQDTDFREEMKSMNGYELYSDHWGSDNSLNDMETCLNDGNYDRLLNYLSDDKYRQFRIHPYGTIEWRGPRDFLNDGALQDIKEFYKKFNLYISKIIEYQNNKTIDINGQSISRDEFFKNLTDAKNNRPENKDRELEFLYRTHGYHDRPLDYKTEKGALPSKKLASALASKPELFYNMIMEEDKEAFKTFYSVYGEYQTSLAIKRLLQDGVAYEAQFTVKLYKMFFWATNVSKIMHDYSFYALLSIFISKLPDEIANKMIEKQIKANPASINRFLRKSNMALSYEQDVSILKYYWDNDMVKGILENLFDGIGVNAMKHLDSGHSYKVMLMLLKLAFHSGFGTTWKHIDQGYAIEEMMKSKWTPEQKQLWNNNVIGALFKTPHNYVLAGLLLGTNYDIKSIVALCSNYKNIYNFLSDDIKNQVKQYLDINGEI